MADRNELKALQASLAGAVATSASLRQVSERLDAALGNDADISDDDLAELARVTLAHAVSAQALRGLVETMRTRRA
jgi:hypothetical protein